LQKRNNKYFVKEKINTNNMLEKYLKIIQESKDKKKFIKDFLDALPLHDYTFDVEGRELKINTNSQSRFFLKLKEKQIQDFCKENNLIFIIR
jgi:hypothetical protein